MDLRWHFLVVTQRKAFGQVKAQNLMGKDAIRYRCRWRSF